MRDVRNTGSVNVRVKVISVPWTQKKSQIKIIDYNLNIIYVFKESALGRFFHRVAMSVCQSV